MSDEQPTLPFEEGRSRPGGPVEVHRLLAQVTDLLDEHGLGDLAVRGVLTGWRRSRTWGHGDLVTPSSSSTDVDARLPLGVPGRAAADIEARLEHTHPGALAANPTVVAVGGLEIHPRFGPLRFVAHTIVIDDVETSRATVERATTLAVLHDHGVFERQRARRLPPTVTSVGILAGAGTAASADFHHRIARHAPDLQIHHLEVVTSGPGAAQAMAAALGRLDRRRLDCIALLRGGGAAVDLTAFDHHDLAVAIANCATPVLTGIGHATDATLADRAAHLALPTPSAVADHLVHHNTAPARSAAAEAQREAERVSARATAELAAQRAAAAADRARLRAALVACAVLALVLALVVVL